MDLFPFHAAVRSPPCPAHRGHSLVNVLVTLTIAGAVAGGAPAVQNLVHDQRLTSQLNQLFGDLHLARTEAIRRAGAVTVCKSSSGQTCNASANWREGWVLFADDNANGQLDAGETVIRSQQALDGGTTLRFGAFGPGSGRYVTYLATGFAEQNGSFTFCDARGAAAARAIILNTTGRLRASSTSSSGGALSCS